MKVACRISPHPTIEVLVQNLMQLDFVDRPIDQPPRQGLNPRMLVIVGRDVQEGCQIVQLIIGNIHKIFQVANHPFAGYIPRSATKLPIQSDTEEKLSPIKPNLLEVLSPGIKGWTP